MSQSANQPALFLSHGAPTLALEDGPARRFLARWAQSQSRPSAIVVFSAHHDVADGVRITISPQPRTVHDFGSGFGGELHAFQYPAPGQPALAGRVATMLDEAGFHARLDPLRGLDHGAWVPLSLMFPAADVPVLQVSIDSTRSPEWHEKLGAALAPLRGEGVLILGSGSATHNLAEIEWAGGDERAPDWVVEFGEWLAGAVETGRFDLLRDYRARGPHAVRNHPTPEHLLPLFAAFGAGGSTPGRRIHSSHTYRVLAMDVYAFGD